jgi:hypothetical protein
LTSESEQQRSKILAQVRALLQPLELLLIATGTLTLLGSVILYFAVAGQLRLMVWVDYEEIYPARLTKDLSLPLSYRGQLARDIRFATITIANVGSNYIGEQQSIWKLYISCPDAESLVVLEDLIVIPSSTVISLPEQTSSNEIPIALGVLESKTEITLHAMVVNPAKPYLKFSASSSLQGLPPVQIGASLWSQFAERFFPLAAFSSLAAAAILFVRSTVGWRTQTRKRAWLTVSISLVKHVLAGAIGAVALTMPLGFVAAGFFEASSMYEAIIQWFR